MLWNFCDGETITQDKTDPCWISKSQKRRHLHMTDLSTCRRDLASCPWTKQNHLEKSSNAKLHTSTLANNGTLRSTADFASTLSNVKTSDLLEFLVMLLFSPHCFHHKILGRKLQDYENIHGENLFWSLEKISSRISFPFSPAILQKHTWTATFLWSYLLQLVRKSNKLVPEQVK